MFAGFQVFRHIIRTGENQFDRLRNHQIDTIHWCKVLEIAVHRNSQRMCISDFEHRAWVLVHKIGDHGFSSINATDIVRKASFRACFFDLADKPRLEQYLAMVFQYLFQTFHTCRLLRIEERTGHIEVILLVFTHGL
ncbi:Hypothetical protein Blongum51A_1425 [Bifidobacterium longum]|nr:Hypothetical protein Blongum51A_1425 [Bifidobacterium longum]